MKLSWDNLKISIAGARLSHLVQKDKIWDHGSMVELVKNIFYKIERAKKQMNAEGTKRSLTVNANEQLNQLIAKTADRELFLRNAVVTEISIIKVNAQKNKNPDRFTVLIKGKRKTVESKSIQILAGGDDADKYQHGIESFSEKWFFIRQGDWWLLDEMK